MSVASERTSRRYQPRIEALEALRLLDHGLAALAAPGLVEPVSASEPRSEAAASTAPSVDTWDAALDATRIADWLDVDATTELAKEISPQQVEQGLDQLNRYLGKAWAQAGIAPQNFDDCTQAVYEALLQNLGRDGFDLLADGVGRHGVRRVLNTETNEGPDFFRAVDMVKKRTQRTKTYQSLDETRGDATLSSGVSNDEINDLREALDQAIDSSLTAREALLIRETLAGKTPAEIAAELGLTSKTVSNDKSRAFQKLRETLAPAYSES